MTAYLRPTEAECQNTVIAAATMAGWLVHAERPAIRQSGAWSTPVQGHPGWPDCVFVHPATGRVIIAELKRVPNKVEPAQQRWIDGLISAGIDARIVWVPEGQDAFIQELVGAK